MASKQTLNEITHEFDVHPIQVSTREKEVQQKAASLFEQKRCPKAVDFVERQQEKSGSDG